MHPRSMCLGLEVLPGGRWSYVMVGGICGSLATDEWPCKPRKYLGLFHLELLAGTARGQEVMKSEPGAGCLMSRTCF